MTKPSQTNPSRAYRHWSAHATFVEAARAYPEFWRIIVGLGLIAATGLTLNSLLGGVLWAMFPEFWVQEIASPHPGVTPVSVLILLGTFGFFTLGCALTVLLLHHRGALTLLGPVHLAWRQFRASLATLIVLAFVILVLPPWQTSLAPVPNPQLGGLMWLGLLPLSLTTVLIQASAEEILFRGYLQQQLAARFRSPWIWMGVPSVLFALGHYTPAEAGENAVLIAVWAGVFGVLMADLTARAGTLGPAIAVHFVNNVSAILIISATDSMNGLALYVSPSAASDPALIRAWLPVDFAIMLVAWLAARLAIRR